MESIIKKIREFVVNRARSNVFNKKLDAYKNLADAQFIEACFLKANEDFYEQIWEDAIRENYDFEHMQALAQEEDRKSKVMRGTEVNEICIRHVLRERKKHKLDLVALNGRNRIKTESLGKDIIGCNCRLINHQSKNESIAISNPEVYDILHEKALQYDRDINNGVLHNELFEVGF